MKIRVVGGGPAGLYFAILMKRADAGHDIEVAEDGSLLKNYQPIRIANKAGDSA